MSDNTKPITTADGARVGIGDRVYNYYDGKWGVIERIDSYPQPDTMKGQNTSNSTPEEWTNYWFEHRDDNGGLTSLDGSRVTLTPPRRAQ